MTFTYTTREYAEQLQTDYREFSVKEYTIDEIIVMHDLKDNMIYHVTSELKIISEEAAKMKEKTGLVLEFSRNGIVNNRRIEVTMLCDVERSELADGDIDVSYKNITEIEVVGTYLDSGDVITIDDRTIKSAFDFFAGNVKDNVIEFYDNYYINLLLEEEGF